MQLFRKKRVELTPICKVCGLEFSNSERMVRHMNKAHSKPCKSKGCNC